MSHSELVAFVEKWHGSMNEDQAMAALANGSCPASVCQLIAQNGRLTAHYEVRLTLVRHRATPQPQAMKFVHYLYWSDLVRLATDVRVHPAVRRAVEARLVGEISSRTPGERIASAKICSRALIRTFLLDPHPRVFQAILANPRLPEEELLWFIDGENSTPEKLTAVAGDGKWSRRHSIRRALAVHPRSPHAVAAAQLRHLSRRDLHNILLDPRTSVYVRRCIESLVEES
ncbi:MAG: hypothetical protein ABI718_00200 [Acidobacteriota bacterium]